MRKDAARDQEGDWARIATCLYRYKNNGIYYAVQRRAGKLIRRSLQTDRLEIAKRLLRDFLGEQEHAAPDAYQVPLGECVEDFLAGRTGLPRRSGDTGHWPAASRRTGREERVNSCTMWITASALIERDLPAVSIP